jgi:hypothetical protein
MTRREQLAIAAEECLRQVEETAGRPADVIDLVGVGGALITSNLSVEQNDGVRLFGFGVEFGLILAATNPTLAGELLEAMAMEHPHRDVFMRSVCDYVRTAWEARR